MSVRGPFLPSMILLCALAVALPGAAQTEETEPLEIGRRGTMSLGVAGFMDKQSSTESALPGRFTLQVDAGRFVTARWFLHGGLVGAGQFATDDEIESGPKASALHGSFGARYYFTPQNVFSPYAGAEYWTQVTHRAAGDRGSLVAKGGLQAALSSRAHLFIESGWGRSLRKDAEGVFVSRWLGLVGVRLRM